MNRLIMSVVLLALVSSASAGTHLIMTIGSHHSKDTYVDMDGNTQPLNEHNFGLGVGYDINNNLQVRAGFYENSYNKTSWYGGGSLHTDITRVVAIGVQAGLVTGYKDVDKYNEHDALKITVLPFVQLRYERVAVEVGYVPNTGNTSVVTFTATYTF